MGESQIGTLQLVVDLLGIIRSHGSLDGLGGLRSSGLDALSDLLSLLSDLLGSGRGLLREILGLVFSIGRTGQSYLDLVGAVLLNELDEVLNGAGAGVVNGGVLLASGEKLDGREALDLIGNIVGGGIDLGDSHLSSKLLRAVQGSELLILRSKSLAVSTPGGIEFKKDVLVVVDDKIIVVLGDDNGNRAFLGLGNRLRLDAGFDLASNEVVDESANVLLSNLLGLVEGVLLVLIGSLDSESGPLADLEVQVATVLTEGLGVDGREVDDALVFLSKGLELFGERVALFLGLGEDVGKGKTRLD
jgi:hypothetical protein